MKHARPAFLLFAFAAFTLPLMPLQQLLLWFSPAAAARLPHWYHRNVARLLGINIRISGARPDKGPAFIVANHVSWLDIIVLSAAAPVSFVAKREVARWPFFGTLARLQRTVFVDRERRHTTGRERQSIDIIADSVQFLGSPGEGGAGGGGGFQASQGGFQSSGSAPVDTSDFNTPAPAPVGAPSAPVAEDDIPF